MVLCKSGLKDAIYQHLVTREKQGRGVAPFALSEVTTLDRRLLKKSVSSWMIQTGGAGVFWPFHLWRLWSEASDAASTSTTGPALRSVPLDWRLGEDAAAAASYALTRGNGVGFLSPAPSLWACRLGSDAGGLGATSVYAKRLAFEGKLARS